MTKLERQAAGFPTSLDLFDKSVQEKSPKECVWKLAALLFLEDIRRTSAYNQHAKGADQIFFLFAVKPVGD